MQGRRVPGIEAGLKDRNAILRLISFFSARAGITPKLNRLSAFYMFAMQHTTLLVIMGSQRTDLLCVVATPFKSKRSVFPCVCFQN